MAARTGSGVSIAVPWKRDTRRALSPATSTDTTNPSLPCAPAMASSLESQACIPTPPRIAGSTSNAATWKEFSGRTSSFLHDFDRPLDYSVDPGYYIVGGFSVHSNRKE
ncbi:unnamed protein product [Darwinula stevensoni]|uniref:Uncharacterized protein n=1 Tax=Darwinula stevensoni TaxID=69355 RepID=A0A7R9FT13_9CRUS|nr:unnamed protein product [Darwinula stevensoni]CAG0905102.1 unnamed protein product [Darwinula stevensoni]